MKKKKITFVINYFYPDLASTGQLMTDLCLSLQNDFEISVIAAQPGYAGETNKSKKIIDIDFLNSIKVIRIRVPEVDKTSKFSRMKYIFLYFFLAIIVLLREKNIDVIYTISQPPILGGLIGTIGKFLKKTKHVYNIQDFNPEQAEAISYTNKKLVYKFAKFIDMLNCSYSDCVVVVGNDMSKTLQKRFVDKKVPNHIVVNNWTDESEITPLDISNKHVREFLKRNNLDNKFVVMYSGNIGLFYDLENLIKVTKYFKDYPDLAFVFIGEGAVKSQMQMYVEENNIKNVTFLPYQPKDFIKYSLNAANLHLVVNQKGILGVSVPSKIYGVMAAGKPIIGVLEQGSEAQILIDNSNCGTVVEPKDYQAVISAIESYYDMASEELKKKGLNGRRYLEENLKKETSIKKYHELLKKI